MKRKTIENKILKPYLVMIIILPILLLLIFNVVMRIHIENSAREEISNSFKAMNTLIREKAIEEPIDATNDSVQRRMNNILEYFQNVSRISKVASNTSIYIFNEDQKIVYPNETNYSEISELLKGEMVVQFPTDSIGRLKKIKTSTGSYLISGTTLDEISLKDSTSTHYLVFVASLNSANDLLKGLNLVLSLFIIVSVLIGSIVAKKVAKEISGPIHLASRQADAIARGKYSQVIPDESSEEMFQLNKSLNQMSSLLKNNEVTQRTFLQNISHELRTPLMSIQGYAEGITQGIFEEDQSPARIIAKESIRLKELVDQLLTLSRLESQSVEVEFKSIPVQRAFLEVLQRTSGLLISEQKEIRFNCEASYEIYANEELFEKTVENLLSNAMRHAAHWIYIDVTSHENHTIIRIEDDGAGFDPEEVDHIFERFFKGSLGNHGLGLAIVRMSVQRMKGTIKAYNGIRGAVFELIFNDKPD